MQITNITIQNNKFWREVSDQSKEEQLSRAIAALNNILILSKFEKYVFTHDLLKPCID